MDQFPKSVEGANAVGHVVSKVWRIGVFFLAPKSNLTVEKAIWDFSVRFRVRALVAKMYKINGEGSLVSRLLKLAQQFNSFYLNGKLIISKDIFLLWVYHT